MCFTGGFALGMMVDERMLAPVLSQPSLPFGLGGKRKAAIGISDADLAASRSGPPPARASSDSGSPRTRSSRPERFETLRRELGDAFIAVEIDSSPGNPHGFSKQAHSVLTHEFKDEPGHPTRVALDRVLQLFREKLLRDGQCGGSVAEQQSLAVAAEERDLALGWEALVVPPHVPLPSLDRRSGPIVGRRRAAATETSIA